MSTPPRHLLLHRWALAVVVVGVLVVAVLTIPWSDVAAVLDPVVDGLRRSVYE